MALARVITPAVCLLFVAISMRVEARRAQEDGQLVNHLMSGYNSDSIPGFPNPIEVNISLSLRRFQELDQMRGACVMNVWLGLYWHDPRLSWNATTWNVGSLSLPTTGSDSIWVPDVLLYNAGETPNSKLYTANAVVTSDGTVSWSRPGPMMVEYEADLKDFPFDKQPLALRFGSWTLDDTKLKLNIHSTPALTVTAFQEHGEWDLKSNSASKGSAYSNSAYHSYSNSAFDTVIFAIELQRRPAYYINQAILPGMILALCAYGSFYMDRLKSVPARTTVLMTSMLTQVTLRIVVSNRVPVMPESTWLERYQLDLLLFNTVALFEWIFVIWLISSLFKMRPWEPAAIHHKQTIDLPWPLRSGTRQCSPACDDLQERLALLREMKEELADTDGEEMSSEQGVVHSGEHEAPSGESQNANWRATVDADGQECPASESEEYTLTDCKPGLGRRLLRLVNLSPDEGGAKDRAQTTITPLGLAFGDPETASASPHAIKAAAKEAAREAVKTETSKAVMDKLDLAMSANSKIDKLIADVQDEIRKRKLSFHLQDAPGPLLAAYFDRFFRVFYLVALIVVTAVKFASVDSQDYFLGVATNPGNYL